MQGQINYAGSYALLINKIKRNLSVLSVLLWFVVSVFTSTATLILAKAETTEAIGNFDNAVIADHAIKNYPVGSYGGWCRVFVNNVVKGATGINIAYGAPDKYFKAFEDAGAMRITDSASLSKGDIVQYGETENDPDLHTFIIIGKVSGSTYEVIDSNSGRNGPYNVSRYNRAVTLNSSKRAYRLGKASGTSTIADGKFIRVGSSAAVYVIAGGAPLRVTNWNNVGGSKPTTSISQTTFNSLPKYPKNGTFIKAGTSNTVQVVAGGAALKISSWNNVGGPKPYVVVDSWAIDNQLRDYPVDGTFIKAGTSNTVQVMAGGAAMKVSNWANVGGPKPYTVVDQWAISHQLRGYPADGTYIKNGAGNGVYVVAGGAAIGVRSWTNVGGAHPYVVVDPWAIDNQLRDYPVDGTYIKNAIGNGVYVVAGGAPLPVSSWANVGGGKSYTNVDIGAAQAQLPKYPKDGTVIKPGTSATISIVAGGMAFKVSSWSNVGGPKPYVIVDQWAIDNYLLDVPEENTFLRGYGSGRIYKIENQVPVYISSMSQVTGPYTNVDDWALRNQLGLNW